MVPSTIDSPIWGMMMSVGMISFHTSPQFEARAGRKQFIIYKRELARGGYKGRASGPRLTRDREFGGNARAGPSGRDRLRASSPCCASFPRLLFFRHRT